MAAAPAPPKRRLLRTLLIIEALVFVSFAGLAFEYRDAIIAFVF